MTLNIFPDLSNKLIVLYRDFNRCIPRHLSLEVKKRTSKGLDLETSHISEMLLELVDWYLRIFDFAEKWNGKVHYIKYENLINSPKTTISGLRRFLNVGSRRVPPIEEQIEFHANLSLKGANRSWAGEDVVNRHRKSPCYPHIANFHMDTIKERIETNSSNNARRHLLLYILRSKVELQNFK